MKFSKVIMNPPYDGNLHLKILEKTLVACPDAEVVNLSPARWIEDPLADKKNGSDYKRFKNSIVDKLSAVSLVDTTTANSLFGISIITDLGIFVFNKKEQFLGKLLNNLATRVLDKIFSTKFTTLKQRSDQMCYDGWRCEIKAIAAGARTNDGSTLYMDPLSRTGLVYIVPLTAKCVFKDGYDSDGKRWFENRNCTGQKTIALPNSIKFDTEQEAQNLADSCKTNFFKNLVYMLKWDVNVPLRFLPFMEDYTHVWTDEDFCKFFNLDEEESKFMCRTVNDYRTKDFVNYEVFE